MGRPRTRSSTLDHDTIRQMKNLFGTVKNAHRILGLQVDVPYQVFYRMLQFMEVTAGQRERVLSRWNSWKVYYLNPKCPVTDEMTLNPMDETLEPEWISTSTPKSKPTKPHAPATRSKPT